MANTPATPAVEVDLKAALDKLSFDLSQLDGKDPAANKAVVKAFHAKVADLKTKGLTNTSLVEIAKDSMPSEAMKSDLESLMTTVDIMKLSEGEATKLVVESLKKGDASGSNYIGSSAQYALYALAVVLLVVLLVAVGGCEDGSYQEYVCDDYYDGYGYYLYSDCYYQTYCY